MNQLVLIHNKTDVPIDENLQPSIGGFDGLESLLNAFETVKGMIMKERLNLHVKITINGEMLRESRFSGW